MHFDSLQLRYYKMLLRTHVYHLISGYNNRIQRVLLKIKNKFRTKGVNVKCKGFDVQDPINPP